MTLIELLYTTATIIPLSAWAGFYVAMIYLILRYRRNPAAAIAEPESEASIV